MASSGLWELGPRVGIGRIEPRVVRKAGGR